MAERLSEKELAESESKASQAHLPWKYNPAGYITAGDGEAFCLDPDCYEQADLDYLFDACNTLPRLAAEIRQCWQEITRLKARRCAACGQWLIHTSSTVEPEQGREDYDGYCGLLAMHRRGSFGCNAWRERKPQNA